MARRSYRGNSVGTTLSVGATSSDTSLTLTDASSFPTGTFPFVVTLDFGQAGEEKVLATSRSGNVLTGVSRGYDGTAATAHSAGSTVRHTLSATDLDEANAHVNLPVDTQLTDIHHTLGAGAFQAAPGNHAHGFVGPEYLGFALPNYPYTSGGSISTPTYQKFVPQATVTVTRIYFGVQNAGGNIDVGIYADSGGNPAAKIVSTGLVTNPYTGTPVAQFLTIPSTTLTAGVPYWLALVCDTGTVTFYYYTVAGFAYDDCRLQSPGLSSLPTTAASAANTRASLLYLKP